MNSNKLTQHCKAVIRGQVDGDKMVAMVALHRLGMKVPESAIKGIRKSNTTNEARLIEAFDVYYNHESFIVRDRHDKYNDAELYAHKLVDCLNSFNGSNVLEVVIGESSFIFKSGAKSHRFIRGKYTVPNATELYKFLANSCEDSEILLRVSSELGNL